MWELFCVLLGLSQGKCPKIALVAVFLKKREKTRKFGDFFCTLVPLRLFFGPFNRPKKRLFWAKNA
jgi:hypothetical protein